MNEMQRIGQLDRFELKNGQIFDPHALKNQIWMLDEERIGFGDLTNEQINHIQSQLIEGEKFEGFNEHHGSQFQQRKNPMIVITSDLILFPKAER